MKLKQAWPLRKWVLLTAVILLGGCGYYPPINVMVIDAETEQPIEGAVLLAQWTESSGMGFNASSNVKADQYVSDQDGKILVEGLTKSGVNKPKVTVYKKGYVAWNNRLIFPDYVLRKGFRWRDGYVFKLERFEQEYLHSEHVSFIYGTYSSGVGPGPFRPAWAWETILK